MATMGTRTCNVLILMMLGMAAGAQEKPLIPTLEGESWTITTNPDLGPIDGGQRQQPVDFAVWQAADGTWQLWSCIRHTKCGGNTRLFYRWEGAKLTEPNWKPSGIAMQADPKTGEQPGGLQAPHVFKVDGEFRMIYGGWGGIFMARSKDGKTFERMLDGNGKGMVFTEDRPDLPANTRDPMVARIGDLWHCYYTAHANRQGVAYVRTSKDLKTWSDSKKVAFGGKAGTGPFTAECPFVVERSGYFYLFRTQKYQNPPETRVYRSRDPMDFGLEDDKGLVATLAVAAPEIVVHEGEEHVVSLLPTLKGMRVQRLKWVEEK